MRRRGDLPEASAPMALVASRVVGDTRRKRAQRFNDGHLPPKWKEDEQGRRRAELLHKARQGDLRAKALLYLYYRVRLILPQGHDAKERPGST